MSLRGYLVKPKIGFVKEQLATIAKDFSILNPNHQLFIPNKFVFGHFKKNKNGFFLSSEKIYYSDSFEDLDKYEENLNKGLIKEVMNIGLSETYVSTLKDLVQEYLYSEGKLRNIVENLF